MKEFWNLVQGEENTLHRQGKEYPLILIFS